MIKKELVQKVSERTGENQRVVKAILEAGFHEIKDAVKEGEKVSLVGFGVFEQKKRAQKKGTNPHDGKPMTIPAKLVPNFRPGRAFKDIIR